MLYWSSINEHRFRRGLSTTVGSLKSLILQIEEAMYEPYCFTVVVTPQPNRSPYTPLISSTNLGKLGWSLMIMKVMALNSLLLTNGFTYFDVVSATTLDPSLLLERKIFQFSKNHKPIGSMYGIFRLIFYGTCREIYHTTHTWIVWDTFRTRRPEKSDENSVRKNFQRFEGTFGPKLGCLPDFSRAVFQSNPGTTVGGGVSQMIEINLLPPNLGEKNHPILDGSHIFSDGLVETQPPTTQPEECAFHGATAFESESWSRCEVGFSSGVKPNRSGRRVFQIGVERSFCIG